MKKLMKSVLACALAFAMVLTVMPVNTYAANKKAVVVTNQKQLEKALKNGATNIVIKTNKNVKITIPASKKAAKASISVQAKNATITNKASVKSIEIKDAKAFVESGKNNDIKITDSKLSLTVSKASKGADIQVVKKDADIKVVAKGDVASVTVAKTANVVLTVNKTAKVDSVNVAARGASVDLNAKGTVSDVKVSEKAADTKLNINASGKVQNVQIDAKADVAVAGSTTEAVKVTVNAKDTTIKAETAVETTLNADAKVDLSKGAEGSKVTTAENVKVDVANNTADKVTVTDSTGKETSVDAGKTETTKDESKKDDEKKDDQKKDDQSSGGSSGGSSGTVTPTPTPTPDPTPSEPEKKIDFLYVEGLDVISVYFNDIGEVPDNYDKNNIVIKDSNEKSVDISSIEKDDNGFYIYLSSAMQDGTYTIAMKFGGTKYSAQYSFDSTFYNNLTNRLKEMADASSKNEITASVTALDDGKETLCEDALLDYLVKTFKKQDNDDYYVELEEKIRKTDNTLSALMSIVLNSSKDSTHYYCETTSNVTFTCTGEAFEIAQPDIKFQLKNSVVVKWMKDYEFACVEAGTTIDQISEEQWTSDSDWCGNIEIENLSENTTYWLYARYNGSSSLYTYKEFVAKGPEYVCFAEPNGQTNFEKESVDAGTEIKVPLLVHADIYGNYDNDYAGPDCELTSSNKELQSFLNRWSLGEWDKENDCPILSFPIPKGLKSGDYTVNVAYRYVYYTEDDDNEADSTYRAASAPVNITVKFHCNAVENPEVKEPEVLYTFSNSIVVKAEDGFQYACAKEGTVVDYWITDRDELGNIEFDSLNPNTTYIVYARLADEWGNYKTISKTTASGLTNPVVKVESDGDKTIDAVEVKAGDTIHIPLKDLKKACYGWNENVRECDHISFNLGNQYESLEDLEASIEEEHPDDDEWYYCLEISVPNSLTTGTYTISFVYTYECFIGEESETPVSQTEPITYTVTFAVAK